MTTGLHWRHIDIKQYINFWLFYNPGQHELTFNNKDLDILLTVIHKNNIESGMYIWYIRHVDVSCQGIGTGRQNNKKRNDKRETKIIMSKHKTFVFSLLRIVLEIYLL